MRLQLSSLTRLSDEVLEPPQLQAPEELELGQTLRELVIEE